MKLRDLSYRYKIPVVLVFVIAVAALVVSATLTLRAYQDARRELVSSAVDLAKTLSRALRPAMLHDDLWQAYEVVTTPIDTKLSPGADERVISVMDNTLHVYVSSAPRTLPVLAPLRSVDTEFASLSRRIAETRGTEPFIAEASGWRYIHVVNPVLAEDGARLGTLVLSVSATSFLPQFYRAVSGVLLSTAIVLVILLPLGWYGGKRIAQPLGYLAASMSKVGREPVENLRRGLSKGEDEIGMLSASFSRMLEELEEKEAMKRQMLASDRLAAIGRLTAGTSHEINNPLGGMLNAISTYKKHGKADAMTARTMSLLERGLTQIQETVAALLVEARLESHALTRQDIEDTRTLVAHDAQSKQARLVWSNELDEPLPLPSTPVRQILLNLLLNAVAAVEPRGQLECRVARVSGALHLAVANDGKALSKSQLEHLYEPFAPQAEGSDKGHGLGLWITYQLVQQLQGRIEATAEPARTSFDVTLPIGADA